MGKWFLRRDNTEYGPYDWEQLISYAREGRILKTDLIREESSGNWDYAQNIPGLFSPAPPLPPAQGTMPSAAPYAYPPPAGANMVPPAPYASPSAEMAFVGVGLRFIALVIDSFVFFVLGYVIAFITGNTTADGYAMEGAPAFLMFIIGIAYFVLMEGKTGGTLGKLALGLRVRKVDGSPCSITDALVRNILRIIDFLPFFYLLGIILIWTSPRKQRLGDRVARTVVVKASSL
ncbi:Uncharacterized membrane protein YckC, RDD family [Thermosyntropha lipolytica DSM 11003]|uniref:Uncharacterized membrane protein YckC, RDD family n=1 Tax=Thermosyntropha lipolytica DSM 11003 TaxID=1123382 RepID=A0A1M5QGZ2_9FIRM|nr:RDD family protein [Thermosyntropha lipolytica]SHH13474.1 Uncharacterized membrane protein YckC, RDD family [Thermosyntropha lipolytica DSM 11003]